MARTILVFGAGDNQLDLIKSCKALGYRTIVTDPLFNPPGKALADQFAQLPPKDLEGHIALIKQEKIEGLVTCQMENPLPLMATLAQQFGFPFPTPEAILNARNKYLMKQAFLKWNVPCAKAIVLLETVESLNTNYSNWNFPVIIKPIDSFSSRGVFLVQDFKQLQELIPKAAYYSSNGQVLIEEFLEGPEVSVESITFKGNTSIVQITDKVITPFPHTVELAHFQPSALPQGMLHKIETVVKKAIKAIGIDNTGSHAELKVTKDGPKMIEIGARLGGDYISSYLTSLSTGINMNKAAAQVAMGEIPDLKPTQQRFSGIKYVNWEPGKTVKKIKPLKTFLQKPKVAHAGIMVKVGDTFPVIEKSSNRHAFVITSAMDGKKLHQNLNALEKEALKLVKFQ
jgi:carbamoyl-phosphate synthase large subunit